jgi:hypothetical protein
MKKLVVLALVLSMAAMASAALTIVGMQGVMDVSFGETLTLSIVSDATISAGVGEWAGWALVTETSMATISGGVGIIPDPGFSIFDGVITGAGFTPPDGMDGVSGTILAVNGPVPAGTIFNNITFAPGTVSGFAHVMLVGTQDYQNLVVLDEGYVPLNDIPEPITITLLGLGGLFLRRRK